MNEIGGGRIVHHFVAFFRTFFDFLWWLLSLLGSDVQLEPVDYGDAQLCSLVRGGVSGGSSGVDGGISGDVAWSESNCIWNVNKRRSLGYELFL